VKLNKPFAFFALGRGIGIGGGRGSGRFGVGWFWLLALFRPPAGAIRNINASISSKHQSPIG